MAFWFRRDLRLEDNTGLYYALKEQRDVIPFFIFDKNILSELKNKVDLRVQFIHSELYNLKHELNQLGSDLIISYGDPLIIWEEWIQKYSLTAIYCNRDYEPYSIQRDKAIERLCISYSASFKHNKDQLIFEADEVKKEDGSPYTVFTAYKNKWLTTLKSQQNPQGDFTPLCIKDIKPFIRNFKQIEHRQQWIQLTEMGFTPGNLSQLPLKEISQNRLSIYDKTRDYPYLDGTSKLGIHFRFGTISIRQKVNQAYHLNSTFTSELIWREFYSMILQQFPHVTHSAFRKKYDLIQWRNDRQEFTAWCLGKTGFPLVDAGMRQLNETGYMHNRVRMVTASFLVKHLLIDWRWGEAYFAEKLLDYELASNNGSWQWCAGCGTDAAPYFRIFNPIEQQKKFDPEFKYIRQWIPEFDEHYINQAIVDLKSAKARCLTAYRSALL